MTDNFSPAQMRVIRTLQEHPDWRILYRVEGAVYLEANGTETKLHRAAVWALMQNGGLVEEQDTIWTLPDELKEREKRA